MYFFPLLYHSIVLFLEPWCTKLKRILPNFRISGAMLSAGKADSAFFQWTKENLLYPT